MKPLIAKRSKAKTLYGIVYGKTDHVLLRYIAEHIADLEDEYQSVKVVSISHFIERDVPVWSALITCKVK